MVFFIHDFGLGKQFKFMFRAKAQRSKDAKLKIKRVLILNLSWAHALRPYFINFAKCSDKILSAIGL
jgi:hypothetical protein